MAGFVCGMVLGTMFGMITMCLVSIDGGDDDE